MKLIIDIDEEMYKQVIASDIIYVLDDMDLIMLENAIANGTPLEEEFEKVKEEIQGLIDFEESCCGNTTLGYQCLGAIKDKISELKGENNA